VKIEEKLKAMGAALPAAPPAQGSYVPGVRTGNLIFLSGVGPRKPDGSFIVGKVGRDLTVEQGQEAARLCALNLLANLKGLVGDLDRVKRIVKVLGMVNCTDAFGDQPKVMNGFSDFMVELFGDRGRHARSAVGMASLPVGIPVEIEMVVELE